MRYFVLDNNGMPYGPADITLLNQWIQEGRVVPTTLLQPEGTQSRLAASTVPGLVFGAGQTYATYTAQPVDTGVSELRAAFICLAVSFFCICLDHVGTVASGLGIFLGYLAYKKGNSVAVVAIVLCALALAAHIFRTFANPILPGLPGMSG